MRKIIAVLVLVPMLGACGPIFGQMMRLSEGVEVRRVEGVVPRLAGGAAIAVVGPFAVGDAAYAICRGEGEEKFVAELNRRGIKGELHLPRRGEAELNLEALKAATPEQLQTELALSRLPDYLLTGTLLQRTSTVAPMRGVVMDETYRFDLVDLRSHGVSRYEIHVRALAQETVGETVQALLHRLGQGQE